MIKTADFHGDGRRADRSRRSLRIVIIMLGYCCGLPHQCAYWSISASIAKDIHHIRFKLFKSYLSVYVHLALKKKKKKRNPGTEQQNDLVFLIPRNYVQISSRRTHATTPMPTFKRRLWVIVWTGGILSLITCSQHNAAHNKQADKFHSSFSLFLLCPLTVIPLPLSFSSGLRMLGWGGGLCSKQGQGREGDYHQLIIPSFKTCSFIFPN